jgi:hypothetical protein
MHKALPMTKRGLFPAHVALRARAMPAQPAAPNVAPLPAEAGAPTAQPSPMGVLTETPQDRLFPISKPLDQKELFKKIENRSAIVGVPWLSNG